MNSSFLIDGRKTGNGCAVYVIAEVGSNHDTSLERAKELAAASKEAGADAFKMQSFTAGGLLNPTKQNGKGWVPHPAYPVLERLTVPEDWHYELMDYSKKIGITFLSAPFDSSRAALLEKVGVPAYKIASGDITNEPLLKQVAGYGKPVILSTGASYLEEVREAVDVITGAGCTDLALLHCAALYPPSFSEVNLRAITTLANEFGCAVGFSDHTPGTVAAVAAVALGASIIEKHITFDRNLPGPDHPYAMEVDEFARMVREIRDLETALGDGVKAPSAHEREMRVVARRSIYANADIKKGAVITPEMLKVVRQAYGLAPSELAGVVGMRAAGDIPENTLLRREDLCK